MAEWKLNVTDADIDAALERAKSLPVQPRALTGEYVAALDIIILHLDNGRRLVLPREQLQGLQNATEAQLSHIEIFAGVDIAWPDLDVDHHLRSLLAHRYGSKTWMESLQQHTVAA